MDRKEKIEYLRRLAAGRLTPEDLLLLLPQKTEVWIHDARDFRQELSSKSFIDEKTAGVSTSGLFWTYSPD